MYKRGNVYWCKITRPNQKPLFQSLGPDRKLAKAIEAKLRLEIHEGKFFDKQIGENLSISDLLDIYYERYAKSNKGTESLRTDHYLSKRLIRYLGNLFLNEVTPGVIEEYMNKRRFDGVGDITIHHELNLLRHAFSLAYKKWDLIPKNPFEKIQLPKGDRKRIRYLKSDEEIRLDNALKGKGWLRSVVTIARETGLRLSNICNLNWNQINLDNRFIEIEKTKNGKPVWIPLTDKAFEEITQLHKDHDPASDRVFIVDGKPIHRQWVGRAFRRLCQRAKIENFRFHDLRHDFCSRLVQAGQSLHVVAELAGHEDISSTQRYAHLCPENKRKAIAALNGCSQKNKE
jgi:integrase